MSGSQDNFRSLASKLIQRIVWLSLLCLFMVGTFKGYDTYRTVQQDFQRQVRMVAENSLPILATALWDIEIDAVERQANWLASLPEIGRVQIQANTGHRFTAGPVQNAPHDQSIAFEITSNDQARTPLGSLEIWPNREHYLSRLLQNITALILDYFILTLLICLAVSWILRRELQDPLQQIATFAASLKPKQLSQPLQIVRRDAHHCDEIDLVVNGFRQLQADLRSHIDSLDATVAERTRQLREAVSEVERLSVLDPLTGCYNRRLLDQRLPAELERCFRYNRPLSVVFVDIDHFKRINDDWGHAAGDAVLREVAQCLLKGIRAQIDWVARYGGEEFLVVLPERDQLQAVEAAERLRALIASTPVTYDGNSIPITGSFGVSEYRPGDSVTSVLARADSMLYAAKRLGRNRVQANAAPDEPSQPNRTISN